ncbi:hypothetical protein ETAC_03540 [Edwardsiella piscicida C07-087]|nr:hypothetical protein ETAC_03540 [Edwardsiella piscicida C07-087]
MVFLGAVIITESLYYADALYFGRTRGGTILTLCWRGDGRWAMGDGDSVAAGRAAATLLTPCEASVITGSAVMR